MTTLFVNSGFLGHASVLALLRAAAASARLEAGFLDLSRDLTLRERALRRLASIRLWRDGWLSVDNLDLVVYRLERFQGHLAARRIGAHIATQGSPRVIHFHTQTCAYGSLDLMRRIPSVVSIDRTTESLIAAARSRLHGATLWPNARRDRDVFRAARAIVAPSRWAGDSVRESYPDCAAKVHVIPYPTRLEGIDPGWIDERARRSAVQGYRPRVLFVGADFPRKGGFELLELWREAGLAAKASLDLVTPWPLEETSLPPGVRVVRGVAPHGEAWRAMWREADLFVMPTREDAFGMVYQEAHAAGLPVVASAVSAVPELVRHGETGYILDPRDRAAWVSAIERLLASAEHRRELGTRGRAHVLAHAPPDGYVTRLLPLLRDASS